MPAVEGEAQFMFRINQAGGVGARTNRLVRVRITLKNDKGVKYDVSHTFPEGTSGADVANWFAASFNNSQLSAYTVGRSVFVKPVTVRDGDTSNESILLRMGHTTDAGIGTVPIPRPTNPVKLSAAPGSGQLHAGQFGTVSVVAASLAGPESGIVQVGMNFALLKVAAIDSRLDLQSPATGGLLGTPVMSEATFTSAVAERMSSQLLKRKWSVSTSEDGALTISASPAGKIPDYLSFEQLPYHGSDSLHLQVANDPPYSQPTLAWTKAPHEGEEAEFTFSSNVPSANVLWTVVFRGDSPKVFSGDGTTDSNGDFVSSIEVPAGHKGAEMAVVSVRALQQAVYAVADID
jgi:hypothetical protein